MSFFSHTQGFDTLEKRVKALFSDVPTIESQRLRFVKISPEHAEDMFEYSSDSDVTKYLTWSCHSCVKETERYIKLLQKKYLQGVFFDWGIVDKQDGKFIGTVGYTSFDYQKNTAEIGYVLSKNYWGKGLIPEAAKTIMEYGFENLGLSGFCAKCIEGNNSSLSVMRKCGMVLEGIYKNSMFIKGEYKTIVVCSVTKEDYYKKKRDGV